MNLPTLPRAFSYTHVPYTYVGSYVRLSPRSFAFVSARTVSEIIFLPRRSKIKLQSLHVAHVVGEWVVEGIDIFQYGNEHTPVVNMLQIFVGSGVGGGIFHVRGQHLPLWMCARSAQWRYINV